MSHFIIFFIMKNKLNYSNVCTVLLTGDAMRAKYEKTILALFFAPRNMRIMRGFINDS